MSAHCDDCGFDLPYDLECRYCAMKARATSAEAEVERLRTGLRSLLDKVNALPEGTNGTAIALGLHLGITVLLDPDAPASPERCGRCGGKGHERIPLPESKGGEYPECPRCRGTGYEPAPASTESQE